MAFTTAIKWTWKWMLPCHLALHLHGQNRRGQVAKMNVLTTVETMLLEIMGGIIMMTGIGIDLEAVVGQEMTVVCTATTFTTALVVAVFGSHIQQHHPKVHDAVVKLAF